VVYAAFLAVMFALFSAYFSAYFCAHCRLLNTAPRRARWSSIIFALLFSAWTAVSVLLEHFCPLKYLLYSSHLQWSTQLSWQWCLLFFLLTFQPTFVRIWNTAPRPASWAIYNVFALLFARGLHFCPFHYLLYSSHLAVVYAAFLTVMSAHFSAYFSAYFCAQRSFLCSFLRGDFLLISLLTFLLF